MSDSNGSQHAKAEFLDTWHPNITDTINLDNQDSTGIPLPIFFSEQVYAEAQSGMSPETLDFLNATDPFNPDVPMIEERSLDIDLTLDWMAPDPFSSQSLNIGITENNVPLAQNNNQQLVPFGQQPPVYNFPGSPFDQYPEQSLQDNQLSSYPSPNFATRTISPPYGRQVLQQSRQLLHSAAESPYSNNAFGFHPSPRVTSNYNPDENTASTKGKSPPSLCSRKISLNRAAKKRGDPSCDPSLCYASDSTKITPWGSLSWNGQHLFSYTSKGQWLRDRCFTKQQFREYADNCGKDIVFWVQQAPTQCNHRLEPEDRICRWANCPVANRTITAGWLRVAFDEFPHLTSSGVRDPLKCAGSVHLWCFEQIFNPLEFHISGRLRPEDRQFPFEDKSVVTLEKLTDAGIIREAYQPWFEQRMFSPYQQPRDYRDSLSYRLTKYHIENQTAARQKARSKRNVTKSEGERRTIDVHMGDLKMFVEATNRVRRTKKIKKLERTKTEDADGLSNSSLQQWAVTSTRPTTNTAQRGIVDWLPELNRGESLSRESYQPRGSSLADRNVQEASGHSLGRVSARQTQSYLAHFPSPDSQNQDSDTYQFNPQLDPRMNSRQPPSYFDPLSTAPYSRQSATRPSITTAGIFPNYSQDIHMDVSNQSYSQNATRQRLSNRATRSGLRPIITQPLQQHAYSLNRSIKRDVFTQTMGETLQLPGRGSSTGLFDSHQGFILTREEPDFDLLIDPRISEDKLEISQYQKEARSEANNAFTAHKPTGSDASRLPGTMDCPVSPQATATSPHWDSLIDFGGADGASLSPLSKYLTATNGIDGERATALTGVSVQHVSSPEVARFKRKHLSLSETTQSRQGGKRRRTETSSL
ncbi:hypothetical protein M431DRAFT_516224 [Trichoderma harzianum CBS 226.95]|uniref:Uncharacterized protein n=1 Tax=Trichoderma harzianum CBS 226.95 TaxID=983964 RepID=A0A2T4APT6_TRIHA|nr:hypothetical protein M431DRAFT_516224 [Trichoderma harzianum CBS 226.95]PTB59075.1 hypothetical protein M431DRAFT_516224 [Trichoderma harzianum CBS 226.95]